MAKAADIPVDTPEEEIVPPDANGGTSTQDTDDTLEETQPSTQILEPGAEMRKQREASPDWEITQDQNDEDSEMEVDTVPIAVAVEA